LPVGSRRSAVCVDGHTVCAAEQNRTAPEGAVHQQILDVRATASQYRRDLWSGPGAPDRWW
jgi:hypothetical protein